MLIAEATKSLDSQSLFQGEVSDSLIKIDIAIANLDRFRSEYSSYREKLLTFIKPNSSPIPWTFKSSCVFERFDTYLTRLHEIRHVFLTTNDFQKLEKIEIGGIRGRAISRKMVQINDEFQMLYQNWIGIRYDPLDPNPQLKHFEQQKNRFREKSDILERKLATLFSQAFDECGNLEQLNKVQNKNYYHIIS